MLSITQIANNWERYMSLLISYSENSTSPENWNKVIEFCDKYADRLSTIPASSKTSYHNAFAGGYVDHVLRVHDAALEYMKLWEKFKNGPLDFTVEELAFVSFFHDFGKFGTPDHEEYLPQDSKWHADRGELYKHNPAITYMKIADRSLYLLQSIGVVLSEKVFLGIKLHDGIYEDGNKGYLIAFSDDYKMKTDLPYVIHQADLLAARIESSPKPAVYPKKENQFNSKQSKVISNFLNE